MAPRRAGDHHALLQADPSLVVMGVSGAGKTELARAVAGELGWRYIEADQFHSGESVERMRAGIALGDAERMRWLEVLIDEMQAAQAAGEGFVLACSALKLSYRERLRAAMPGLRFAHLYIDQTLAVQRVAARAGHFMPSALVESQFATLEDPSGEPGVLVMDASQSPSLLCQQLCAWLNGRS